MPLGESSELSCPREEEHQVHQWAEDHYPAKEIAQILVKTRWKMAHSAHKFSVRCLLILKFQRYL